MLEIEQKQGFDTINASRNEETPRLAVALRIWLSLEKENDDYITWLDQTFQIAYGRNMSVDTKKMIQLHRHQGLRFEHHAISGVQSYKSSVLLQEMRLLILVNTRYAPNTIKTATIVML